MLFIAVLVCVILICLGCFTLLLYQRYSKSFRSLAKIPGPRCLPLVGDWILFNQDRQGMFNTFRERGKKYFPIYGHFLLYQKAVCLMDPVDVELVLSSMKHIKKGILYDLFHPWLGSGLLTSDGHKWQSRRKILTPAFHFSILKEFLHIFNNETEKFVKRLQSVPNQSIDVVPLINEFTLLAITETSMGIKLDFNKTSNLSYKNAIDQFFDVVFYRSCRPWLYDNRIFLKTRFGFYCKKVAKILHNFSNKVIEERKKIFNNNSQMEGKRKSFLDILLSAKMNGENIDDDGIREEVDTFMFEGHDTTGVALTLILMTLANEQKIQDEIFEEMMGVLGSSEKTPTYNDLQELPFTERCIKECLRLYPSVPYIARDAGEDIHTSQGYVIPKGTLIHITIYDIHRNPSIYPEPDQFNPDRFLPENIKKRHPFAYIPFSAGPRNCIGQKFAMLELKTVLCGILRKFRLEPVDTPNDLEFVMDLVLRSKKPVRVKFVPRHNKIE